jgi:NADPH-dependent glutamate synthase beta subunit-like oxidoreductase
VLRYGIPSFRLPRDIIEREVARLSDIGVRFETNKVVGKTFTIAQLTGTMGFDAVFIAAGAGAPAFLGIPGESAGQVFSANEFLTRVNLMGGDQFPYRDTPIGLGDDVVVIGAGNTAMDCLRVARRLGASRVRCVYRRSEAEAPARVEELRHAREEGVEFCFLHAPVAIDVDADGNVRGIEVEKMALGEPDARGRRAPVPLGEFVTWPCDRAWYQGEPDRRQGDPGPCRQQLGIHRRRRGDAGDQPAGRVCGRRHRHRRRDGDPCNERRAPRGARDRGVPAARAGALAADRG